MQHIKPDSILGAQISHLAGCQGLQMKSAPRFPLSGCVWHNQELPEGAERKHFQLHHKELLQ